MLTDAEIEAYRRDGYVIPAGFRLGSGELETLRSAVEQVLRDNPAIEPDRVINPHLDRGRPYRLRGHRTFHDIVHDDRILDIAESVVGPDLVLLFTHLFCKTPR
ncbi:MAG: phytanoyl-CoA dioxygenase family protein, partial [Alphaproteobacteria bacterium]|nr:phytanoyl-CoA dioxygenase family protein [Alphaproteobacteria bacterium]